MAFRNISQGFRRLTRRFLGLEEDAARAERRHQDGLGRLQALERRWDRFAWDVNGMKTTLGGLHAARVRAAGVLPSLRAAEFRIHSQFGDDGIIQYLMHLLAVQPDSFIEFGVTDYTEANTRFLVEHDNWRGLVLDGDPAMVARIRADPICVFHDVTPVAAFIDRDNVNDLFATHGYRGPLGLLSVDIDGNDYWVWEAITVVDPVVVVCEYNSTFGPERAVSVPYDPTFLRQKAHPSKLYYGASLAAFCHLAERKGYAFVGSNSNGNNAYFVRHDRLGPLRPLTPAEGWVPSRFREAAGADGAPAILTIPERLALIGDKPLVDVVSGVSLCVAEIVVSPTLNA